MDVAKIVGFVAGVLTMIAVLPQVRHTWRTKSTKDISLREAIRSRQNSSRPTGCSGRSREETMKPTLISLSMALVCALSFGCAGQLFTTSEMVMVSDIHMVVGRWDGIVEKRPLLINRGPVSLTIREDSLYIFIGVDFWEDRLLAGNGELVIRDGRLHTVTDEQHRAIMTLYKRGEEEVLIVEATNAAGKQFHVEFTRSPLPPLP